MHCLGSRRTCRDCRNRSIQAKESGPPRLIRRTSRGIEAFHRFTQKDTLDAVRYFQSAVELDPESARAYAWLADSYSFASTFDAEPSKRELSLQAAQRSIELGDTSGHAEAIIAANSRWNGDFEAAQVHMERALALGPTNPDVLSWAGFFRLWQGRAAEARDIGNDFGGLIHLIQVGYTSCSHVLTICLAITRHRWNPFAGGCTMNIIEVLQT